MEKLRWVAYEEYSYDDNSSDDDDVKLNDESDSDETEYKTDDEVSARSPKGDDSESAESEGEGCWRNNQQVENIVKIFLFSHFFFCCSMKITRRR